jgi:hypothetical protein
MIRTIHDQNSDGNIHQDLCHTTHKMTSRFGTIHDHDLKAICCGQLLRIAPCGIAFCRTCGKEPYVCVHSVDCFKCEYCSDEPICTTCFGCGNCNGAMKWCEICGTCNRCSPIVWKRCSACPRLPTRRSARLQMKSKHL